MLKTNSAHLAARAAGQPRDIASILVLKLDHLGDFIIGLPALEQLRQAFPRSRIRLICGPWNREFALATGLVDEVRCYTYFPQNARHWDGRPVDDAARFAAAAEGHWDLAVDLRVDEDTRFLLRQVDAGLRCGIGKRESFADIDILLPPELEFRTTSEIPDGDDRRLTVDQFNSAMPFKVGPRHETDFRRIKGFLVSGPGIALPCGHYRVSFECDLRGRGFGALGVALTFEACADGVSVASLTLTGRAVSAIAGAPAVLHFTNTTEGARFDFRIRCTGRPLFGRFGFRGCRLQCFDNPNFARLRPVELHIGEKLSLLVCLIVERTRRLYHDVLPAEVPIPEIARTAGQKLVVIAPTSNSTLRDWPPRYYTALIDLLRSRLDCQVVLTGAPDQADAIRAIVGPHGTDPRVTSLAGTLPWSALPSLLRQADLVVCNNSGVAHLAAAVDARVLALYSASHEVSEWGPRGRFVRVLTLRLPCSPCGHDVLSHCHFGHACMEGLTPEAVFGACAEMLAAESAAAGAAAEPAFVAG